MKIDLTMNLETFKSLYPLDNADNDLTNLGIPLLKQLLVAVTRTKMTNEGKSEQEIMEAVLKESP